MELKEISRKEQFKRAWVLARKNLKIYYNKGPVLIQGLFLPVIIFFAFTIGREIDPVFMISGLLTMVIFLTGSAITPIVLPWETMQQNLERIMTCPIKISTIIIGDIISSFCFGLLLSIIPLTIGFILFAPFAFFEVIILLLGLLITALFAAGFGSLLTLPPIKIPSNVMILQILVKYPLLLITPIFAAFDPRSFVLVSPFTYFIDLVNYCLGKPSAFGSFGVWIDLAALCLSTLILFVVLFKGHAILFRKRFSN